MKTLPNKWYEIAGINPLTEAKTHDLALSRFGWKAHRGFKGDNVSLPILTDEAIKLLPSIEYFRKVGDWFELLSSEPFKKVSTSLKGKELECENVMGEKIGTCSAAVGELSYDGEKTYTLITLSTVK